MSETGRIVAKDVTVNEDLPEEESPSTEVSLAETAAEAADEAPDADLNSVVFEISDLNVYYGSFRAVRDVTLNVRERQITALIGPSGCGKSTVLRCFNRMNDLIPGARAVGTLNYHGVPLYGPGIDPVEVRRRIGMVFQKPNPFPKSVYDNVAYGPRLFGIKRKVQEEVEALAADDQLPFEVQHQLRRAAARLEVAYQRRLLGSTRRARNVLASLLGAPDGAEAASDDGPAPGSGGPDPVLPAPVRASVEKLIAELDGAQGRRLLGPSGNKAELDMVVEESLSKAALWDDVNDRLKESAMGLSGGQQQRLCIARALATRPDVVLMDEPCSALDPIATARIEDLMQELKTEFTIVIVTHNMQQAARASDETAFFSLQEGEEGERRSGTLIEFDRTETIFSNPSDERTENYITGRFG